MAKPLLSLLSLVALPLAPLSGAAEGRSPLELVRDPVAEAVLAEIMEEALGTRVQEDSEVDEAALIVGALLGLAALERAARDDAAVDPVLPVFLEPEPVSLPAAPVAPTDLEPESDAALPEPSAEAPLGPPRPIGEPSPLIPPPPPLAEDLASGSSSDVAVSLDRAEQNGETGF